MGGDWNPEGPPERECTLEDGSAIVAPAGIESDAVNGPRPELLKVYTTHPLRIARWPPSAKTKLMDLSKTFLSWYVEVLDHSSK